MKKTFLISVFSLILVSCGSHRSVHNSHRNSIDNRAAHHSKVATSGKHHKSNKKTIAPTKKERVEDNVDNTSFSVRQEIIDYAKTFQGTRYKFGGTTKAGMDCSGLISIAFERENIHLPRTSREMATKGVPISLKNVEKGDLIFFKTSSRNVISHVGLVVEAKKDEIRFIHSTTRAGVIISSLDETYWKKAFTEARRVM